MVPKNVFAVTVCTMLLAWSGMAVAEEYRPDQFLGLDLSRAVLSPKRLGPPAEFAPLPVEARSDRGRALARAERIAEPEIRAHPQSVKRPAVAHARLARHHGNPLDAQAFDTRIQVWPCKSGGICGWQRWPN